MSTLIAKNEIPSGAFVPTSAVATSVAFDDEMMHVSLSDGRIISSPLTWFPRLRDAARSERENYEIGPAGIGIHWPDIDEDLSVAGLMGGVNLAAG